MDNLSETTSHIFSPKSVVTNRGNGLFGVYFNWGFRAKCRIQDRVGPYSNSIFSNPKPCRRLVIVEMPFCWAVRKIPSAMAASCS